MRICWVDKEGRIHEGGSHHEIATKLFPRVKNAERSCERARYVKLGHLHNGFPMMENYDERKAEQAQINTVNYLWKLHHKRNKTCKATREVAR